ncbi:hypothetical protein, partial [Lactiplantibacillus pentosus]|uniref:hypothetical protein n=1 Tax=Lactiplantibacillus pentosus TaxID=1589 RepID=UPI0021A3C9E9
GNDNVATDLTNATSITVKLGNASGYLKSATVAPASLTDPTTGQVTIKFNADLMTSLPAGSYAIEVWVVDPTGTSIYPSDGSTGFTITNNIQSANGSVITTITFDDFVNKFNTIAANALPGTTDTTNFQKTKITADDGSFIYKVFSSDDVNSKIISASGGMTTWYVQSGATNSPDSNRLIGFLFKEPSGNFGNGLFTTDNNHTWQVKTVGGNIVWNNLVAQTTGTLDVTSSFYKSGTTSSTGALNYVLTGNVLHVSGYVSPSANLAAGTDIVLFNLPSSIGTIENGSSIIQQSAGLNLYCLSWSSNGAVSVLKHNTAGTLTAITTTTTLQVCADIVVN